MDYKKLWEELKEGLLEDVVEIENHELSKGMWHVLGRMNKMEEDDEM